MRLASRILRLAFVGAALIIPLVESDSRIVGGDEATVGDYPYYGKQPNKKHRSLYNLFRKTIPVVLTNISFPKHVFILLAL